MTITNTSSSKSYKPFTPGCFAPGNQGWKSVHHSQPANAGQPEWKREPRRCLYFWGRWQRAARSWEPLWGREMLETRLIARGKVGPLQTLALLIPHLPFWHRREPFSAGKRRHFRATLRGGEGQAMARRVQDGAPNHMPSTSVWRRLWRRSLSWEGDFNTFLPPEGSGELQMWTVGVQQDLPLGEGAERAYPSAMPGYSPLLQPPSLSLGKAQGIAAYQESLVIIFFGK